MVRILEAMVAACLKRPWLVVALTAALTGWSVYYSVRHFAINTNTAQLISPDIDWRRDEIAWQQAFPHLENLIVAVLDGPSAEAADAAADRLAKGLSGAPHVVRVWRPDSNDYLTRQGLLLTDKATLENTLGELTGRKDFLAALAADPSLRGLMGLIGGAMEGAQDNQAAFESFVEPLGRMAATIEAALKGVPPQQAALSWRALFEKNAPTAGDRRRLVLIEPKLDFGALEPGAAASRAVRTFAREAFGDSGVRLRLTGPTPLADEEFSTVAENYELNMIGTILAVAAILVLALRSAKLIFAVLATLFAGLAITSWLGLFFIGTLNLISVAFAVLFIGLGVDFGIQFSTRYRQERAEGMDVRNALIAAAHGIGYSLTLAAVSLVAGFFSFLPTEFRGVSELGFIAGLGMIVAFLATLTFLPALIVVLKPGAEKRTVETAALAKVDAWIARHRAPVLIATALVTLAGVPALMKLKFDSNPMHLRSAHVESVSTFNDLSKDPNTAPNTISILAPSLDAAKALAARLEKLPTVERAVTLATFAPEDVAEKIAAVCKAAKELAPALNARPRPAPSDAENLKAIDNVVDMLKIAEEQGAPAPMVRFTRAAEALLKATPAQRTAAQEALFFHFPALIAQLRLALDPRAVGLESVPADVRRDWLTPDGRARVEVSPKGDSSKDEALQAFAREVRAVAPQATGAPVTVYEAGATIVRSFALAGALAFVAIFAILYFAMRSVRDVLLALGPLVLAGVMTLEAAQLLGMSLDYANIIALPLMFGVGVAFHIYYLIAWRKGVVDMLASSLTRAIFFSALTTGTAFGSLWLSSHPGTSGMGKLLALSLFFTLLAAFIIVPAFLGPPPAESERLPAD